MRDPAARRGVLLVLVAGLLAILALVGTVFVTRGGAFREAVRLAVDAARARLLARSGAERAWAGLRAGEVPSYGGEDYDGDGVWAAAGIERTSQTFRPGALDTDGCPVDLALRPTWFATGPGYVDGGGNRAPEWTRVESRSLGYTGRLRGTYVDRPEHRGNTYSLKVVEAGGIWVNGGDPSAPSDAGYNGTLRRILGTLAEAVDREDGANDGVPADQPDGEALVDSRPPTGWETWDEILAGALGGDAPTLAALRPYLALDAWVDRSVIRPNAPALFADPGQVRYVGTSCDHRTGAYHEVKGDPPGPPTRPALELESGGRASVPLGWAMRHPVALVALLADLRGVWLDERVMAPEEERFFDGSLHPRNEIGSVQSTGILLNRAQPNWSSSTPTWDDARSVARRLALWDPGTDLDRDGLADGELDTWEEWNAFCDDLVDDDFNGNGVLDVGWDDANGDGRLQTDEDRNRNGLLDPGEVDRDGSGRAEIRPFSGWPLQVQERQAKAAVLKANFNPNSDLNKFNPNPTLWRAVDKSDLVAHSTEFCLWPCLGYEVESAGRVVAQDGRLMSIASVRARQAAPRVARITTQREFACRDLGDLDRAGDEADVRQPGISPYLSESRGVSRTWGHRLASAGWLDGDSQGAALQLYPEPHVTVGGGIGLSPADWDGSVQLATIETRSGDTYGVSAGPSIMTLLARYDDGFDLDVAGGDPAHRPDVRHPPVGQSVLDSATPGTLHPDGTYAERDRAPMYATRGNLHGFHGLMSFWVKPGYQMSSAFPSNIPTLARRWIQLSNKREAGLFQGVQFFSLTHSRRWGQPVSDSLHLYCEIGGESSDVNREHRSITPPRRDFDAHRWYLATIAWDFWTPAIAQGGMLESVCEVVVDGGGALVDRDGEFGYGSNTENAPSAADDLTQPDVFGRDAALVLGRRVILDESSVSTACGYGADATFDEIVAYDFGGAMYEEGPDGTVSTPAPAETIEAPYALASERYAAGRYYKGGAYWRVVDPPPAEAAGAYVSAPLALPAGARVEEVRWTFLRSRQRDAAGAPRFPGDYAALEIVGPAGLAYPGGDDTWRSSRRAGESRWRVDRVAPASFRLRALLCRDVAVPDDVPILDSPVLDDITILYRTAGGSPLASWSEGP